MATDNIGKVVEGRINRRAHSPVRWVRLMTAHRRTSTSDRQLATVLAGVAGCANAGGFILIGSYTSHMTGYLSQMADQVVLQNVDFVVCSLIAITLFILGAATSAVTINWARQHKARFQYSLPIGLQGVMFLLLAIFGSSEKTNAASLGLALLCFIMGLQNATITKISGARIRTTHATGMITDIGIEIGKTVYGRLFRNAHVSGDITKFLTLVQLVCVFFFGGLIGAMGYAYAGFLFSVPLAFILIALAVVPNFR